MFKDHAVQQGADDTFLIGVEEGDGLELELEIVVGAALIVAKQLQIRTHLESARRGGGSLRIDDELVDR